MAIWKRMRRIEDEAADSGWEDDNSSRDWEAGLPEGILGMISDRLSVSDCLSFIDICCSWSNAIEKQLELNSKAQPPSMLRGLPLLLGPGQRYRRTRIGLSVFNNFSSWEIDMPEAYMKYYWGSFHDWLILVKDLRPLNRIDIQLYNPFYGLTIDLPTSLNVHPKIVVSGLPCEKNFACILLPSGFPIPYFWVPGLKQWHDCCRLSRSVHVVDAVSCNGYFYLLTDDFNLVTIDLSDVFPMVGGGDHNNFVVRTQLHEVQMSERPKNAGLGWLRYLVESQGEILLVCRFFDTKVGHTYDTTQFTIYKLDASHQMAWSELHSLGDRILFLGRSSSRSFSAQDLGVREANCIYFTNEQPIVNYNEWDETPFRNKLSCFAMEGLEENSDWGRYDFNDEEDVGNFTFHGNRDHFFPVWITAPLSMFCGGMKRCVKF